MVQTIGHRQYRVVFVFYLLIIFFPLYLDKKSNTLTDKFFSVPEDTAVPHHSQGR